jgi:hypothetical protein
MESNECLEWAGAQAVYEKALMSRATDSRPGRIRRILRDFRATAVRWTVLFCLALAGWQANADENPLPAMDSQNLFSDVDYRLGEGLKLGNTGISLGGYATASYQDAPNTASRIALDDLSLFIWWQGDGRWKFFTEIDLENFLASNSAGQEGEDDYLAIERLYLDYDLSDMATIRLGKFLTPIGRWNLIHAAPLVWTTSRPLTTSRPFPTNVTGLMLYGTLPVESYGVDYMLYASQGDEIRPNPILDPFYDVFGAHVVLPFSSEGQIGVSFANFEQENSQDENKRLLGLDFFWSHKRYEFSSEAVYRVSDKGSLWDEKGIFGQLVVPLSEKAYAVGRYEYFHPALETQATQLFTAGLNYRYTPAVVLKAEWVGSKNNDIGAPEGFLTSINILF